MVVESLPSFQGRLMPHGIEKRNKEDEDRGLPRKRSLFLVHLRFIYNVKQNVLADC
ncbi:BnaC08g48670D [Brassica napus]|uniref:BnaC08g48670D protein n=1 Tax=Brassica napus TaxID=3708 RepID=A0A078J1W5_BRANA|nr:BnaC08g48670D [Brassica napus]